MASRRCPHCKVESSYQRGGEKNQFGRTGHQIRFDLCRNEDCASYVAVVFHSDTNLEIATLPPLEDEPDEDLPPDVRVAFAEALKALREGVWNGCVIMSVRALAEAATDLDAQGESVYAKIENLADTHRITPDLASWAHEGRLAANLGRHGDEKKKDEKKWNDQTDAEEIVEFSKWFFRYVYMLPAQLEDRKKRLEAEAKLRSGRTAEADSETPPPSPEAR